MGIQFQDRSALGGTGPDLSGPLEKLGPQPAGLPAMPERAAPGAWSVDMAGRPSPQGAAPDSASAVSTPLDPAAEGNDADAPKAQDPGREGEPHSRQRFACLGSTDKELKAGATAEGSAPTELGTLGVELMDPGLWVPAGKGYGESLLSLATVNWTKERSWGRFRETLAWTRPEAGQAKAKDRVVRDALLPLELPAGGGGFWPVSVASITRLFQEPRFHPVPLL